METSYGLLLNLSPQYGLIHTTDACTDISGNIYISGYFSSTTIIGTFTLTQSGGHDFCVIKYSPNGTVLWAVKGGGSLNDMALSISSDNLGDIYVTGKYASPTLTINSSTFSNAGDFDVFVAKYSSSGSFIWAKTFGGPGPDIGCRAASYSGGVYLSGRLGSNSVSIGNHTINTTVPNDAMYIVQLNSLGNSVFGTSITGGGGTEEMGLCLDGNCSFYIGGAFINTLVVVGINSLVHSIGIAVFAAKYNTGVNAPTLTVNGNFTVCAGVSTTLTVQGASNYTWSSGQTTSVVVVSPTTSSLYLVTGSTPSLLCNSSTIQGVQVNPSPTLSVVNNSVICSGRSATLSVIGANTYTWNTGIQTQTMSIFPPQSSTYVVSGVSLYGCNYSLSQQILVNPSPTLITNANYTMICMGNQTTLTASGAGSYNWNNGQQSQAVVVSPTSTTTFSVVGTNVSSGCTSSSSILINVSECLSVSETNSRDEVHIYPNPNNGRFSIDVEFDLINSEYVLINELNQIVKQDRVHQNLKVVDCDNCCQGLYYLILFKDKRAIHTQKILIQ